jgi:hypothetical protein
MMKKLVAAVLFCPLAFWPCLEAHGQGSDLNARQAASPVGIASYLKEDFEGQVFPPAGWAIEYTGGLYWVHSGGASAYGVGTASAEFRCIAAPANTTQSLVIASMSPSAAGDSLRFDYAHATYPGGYIDHLAVEASADGGITFTLLEMLIGNGSGSLDTAPPLGMTFLPSPSQWATRRYPLPVGTNRIRFRAISGYGNNLFLDNITFGNQRGNDVGPVSIDIANPTVTLPQIPLVSVKNHGTLAQNFTVTLCISPGGYSCTKNVAALGANATTQVAFDFWTPTVDTNRAVVYSSLGTDEDHANDTLLAWFQANPPTQVRNINAVYKHGQVFITWDNLQIPNVKYSVFKSPTTLVAGSQLATARNLGFVRQNSALDQRLTELSDGTPKYLRIDSATAPLGATKGVFVATSTEPGSFYYAVTVDRGGIRDTTLSPGANSLTAPLEELVEMPQPVWQEQRVVGGRLFDVYVQFVTKVTSSQYPQMTNLGSIPFHFAIVKSGSQSPHPVTFWLHPGESSFLSKNSLTRLTGDPNEWVITVDDWTPSANESNVTLYYGYHEDYDMTAPLNVMPVSGTLHDYTCARVVHTVDWARNYLPLDTARTYMTGWSMGAIGSLFSSLMMPEKIAAIFIFAPAFDLTSFYTETADRMWGSYESNLPTNQGYRRNERLNAIFLMRTHKSHAFPIVYTFCGKNDGWGDEVKVYNLMDSLSLGGVHFWSGTDHYQTYESNPWSLNFPNFSLLTRYRTNLSYPAFSKCTANDNPGNGTPADGAALGTINGHLDWDEVIVDSSRKWEITLRLKDLVTTQGADPAPDSATADVTLRRLQAFAPPKGCDITWTNFRGGVVVQQRSFHYDSGLVTLSPVKIYKGGSTISVTWIETGVADGHRQVPEAFALEQNYPNPFNGTTVVSGQLPVGSRVRLVVYDMLGREVATLLDERKEAGRYSVTFDAAGVASGVYVYRLMTGDHVEAKTMMLLK